MAHMRYYPSGQSTAVTFRSILPYLGTRRNMVCGFLGEAQRPKRP